MTDQPRYRRVVVKLSGESFCGPSGHGIDVGAVGTIVGEVRPLIESGIQVALVVGAGNLVRGRDLQGQDEIQRTTADYMGMVATVVNGLALRDAMAAAGLVARVMSAFPVGTLAEPFGPERAIAHLDRGRAVIFVAGTGCPLFTTDTCAALRAGEVRADLLVKATKVDGVFDSDPVRNPGARRHDRLTYQQVLDGELGVMDMAAVLLCRQTGIPIRVLALGKPGNLSAAARGQEVGTLITA